MVATSTPLFLPERQPGYTDSERITYKMALRLLSLLCILATNHHRGAISVEGLVQSPSPSPSQLSQTVPRRAFLVSSAALLIPKAAGARFILNEDGEFEEVEDKDWQTTWKERLDKAQSMGTDEVFNAARGAGNLDLKEGPESDASRKRRAMSACRDGELRKKAGAPDAKDCNARVVQGETDFMLGPR